MGIIKFENVSFSYELEDSEKLVLENFSLDIKEGSFVAILGHNGSGKSTIAKLTNGILYPDKGKVFVDGIETKDDESIYDVRRTLGMVFQNPDNQIVSSIVEEDVAFGCENLGIPSEEIRQRVDDALKKVGMYEHRLDAPSMLSGGQKQRIAVAGIIAMKPKIIVLDEPTAMLDPQGRKEVMETIMKLNREEGITILLITHYMDEAVKADRVVVMDDGVSIMDGAPKDVFRNVEKLKNHHLETPQSTEFVNMLGIMPDDTILNSTQCAEFIFNELKK